MDEFLLDLRRNERRLIERNELSKKKEDKKLEDSDLDLGLDRGKVWLPSWDVSVLGESCCV